MVKEFFLPLLVINYVFFFRHPVVLICIHQHDKWFFHPSHSAVHLDTLVPVNRSILITKSYQQWSLDILCLVNRRVAHMFFHPLMPWTIKPSLAGLENFRIRDTGVPVD